MLRPNTTYTIKAEYGTEILSSCYSTTDYLLANATPTYNASTKKYTCSFSFARPSNYSCLKIEFRILDPGDPIGGEYVTFISAAFYMANNQYALTTEFPIDNNRIEVLYNGEFTAYGVYLKRSHSLNAIALLPFDSANDSYNFTVTRGHITNMLLIYPYPMWQ